MHGITLRLKFWVMDENLRNTYKWYFMLLLLSFLAPYKAIRPLLHIPSNTSPLALLTFAKSFLLRSGSRIILCLKAIVVVRLL